MKLVQHAPLIAALILLAGGGLFLLEKAERQARDTVRKHHLQDIEQSLYFARSLAGVYPPYEQSSWCGFLNDPKNEAVRNQVEKTLRTQNATYANPDKPFPADPLIDQDYFYWKRSPTTFELYATLEAEKNGERNSQLCENAPREYFDYGLASIQRDHGSRGMIVAPL